jgi:hypothetical protein
MKLPFPDWQMANLTLEGYAEDGVSGTLGYASETGNWFAQLDDKEYEQYMVNLRRQRDTILRGFTSIDWHSATNIQGVATEPPKDNENRLSLYLIDCDCKTAKSFKLKASLTELMQRKEALIYVGSTCMNCRKKSMVVLTWEDVRPKKGDKS